MTKRLRALRAKTIHAADLFCGAGGTSSGLLDACAALGYRLNLLAVNHWDIAIETHSANHPYAKHLCENLDVVDPRKVVPSGRLDLLIASPECTHHSNARGGKPMSDQSRASAWHVARWAEALHISNILIENVREFRDWGPLDSRGRPIKKRKGELYHAFLNALRATGYVVEDRILNAADYGDPTSRRRLFILARKGRRRVTWPEPTHSPRGEQTLFGQLPPYRTAREIIDWERKGESVFNRKRPLSPNTMARIFAGLHKFGGLPFVVPNEGFYRGNQPRSVDDPIPTITSRGGGHVAQPFLVKFYGQNDAASVDQPLPTVTAKGQHLGLAQPFLIKLYQGSDAVSLDKPLPTVTANYEHLGLAVPYIVTVAHGGHNKRVRSVNKPLPTVTAQPGLGLAVPFILAIRGGDDGYTRGAPVDSPLPAITTSPALGVVEPYLVEYYTERDGQEPRVRSVDKPIQTVTAQNRIGLAQPFIIAINHGPDDQRSYPLDKPMPTITSVDAWAVVEPRPFIVQYNGQGDGAHSVDEPLNTVTSRDRFGLAIPVKDGLIVVDILFRMLQPHELSRAHSFGDDYIFAGTREEKVKQIGNSVPRNLAKALCLAALS